MFQSAAMVTFRGILIDEDLSKPLLEVIPCHELNILMPIITMGCVNIPLYPK